MIFLGITDLPYLIDILELGNLLLFICASYRDIGILIHYIDYVLTWTLVRLHVMMQTGNNLCCFVSRFCIWGFSKAYWSKLREMILCTPCEWFLLASSSKREIKLCQSLVNAMTLPSYFTLTVFVFFFCPEAWCVILFFDYVKFQDKTV